MLSNLGIENFRIFKDYTEFEFAPVTVLTGTNNSGKSTLIKLTNLIQQSVKGLNSLNVLNFLEGSHNLGTFSNSINWNSDKNEISITFNFPLDYYDEDFNLKLTYRNMGEVGFLKSFKIFNENRVLLLIDDINLEDENSQTIINGESGYEYYFTFDIHYIKKFVFFELLKGVEFYDEKIIKAYYKYYKEYRNIHKEKYLYLFGNTEILSYKNFKSRLKDHKSKSDFESDDFLPLREFVKSNFPDFYKEKLRDFDNFLFFTYLIPPSEDEDENNGWEEIQLKKLPKLREDLFQIEKSIGNLRVWIDNYHLKNQNSDLFTDAIYDIEEYLYFWKERHSISEYFLGEFSSEISEEIFDNLISIGIPKEHEDIINIILTRNIKDALGRLKFFLKNIGVLSPKRVNGNRIIIDSKNDEISDLLKEYSQLKDYLPNSNFIEDAFNILGIKGVFDVKRIDGTGTLCYLINGENKINISDLGFGYSQLIPIVLKIVLMLNSNEVNVYSFDNSSDDFIKNSKPIFIIEEPEANLHPNLQSKLADVFVLAYKTFGIRFILETHSEYLIRKLQYLTAKKEIDPGEVNIYYFNADEFVTKEEPKVKKIQIDEFGALSDSFGPGFYDEATNLKFELLKLNKGQNN